MDENPYRKAATERVQVASEADVEERLAFIRRTYLHLFGAILAFVGAEFAIFQSGMASTLAKTMVGGGSWLLVLMAFVAVGWIANKLALSGQPTPLQYVGLGLYVAAMSVIFVPLMFVAANYSDPTVIPTAGIVTLSVFSVLTGYVFVTKQDFSFLGPALAIISICVVALIVASILFGFQLGVFFAGGMVVLMAGYIVYYTSNILHHYRTDQHVAAALALFSAVAMLFYYVLMLFIGLDD